MIWLEYKFKTKGTWLEKVLKIRITRKKTKYNKMYESIYKTDELENEVSLDMNYFWYSDNAKTNLQRKASSVAILYLLLIRQALCCYPDPSMSSIHHSTLCILHLSWANKPKCNQTFCKVWVYYSVLKNLFLLIILLAQVKFIPSEKFLDDDLTNPYSKINLFITSR